MLPPFSSAFLFSSLNWARALGPVKVVCRRANLFSGGTGFFEVSDKGNRCLAGLHSPGTGFFEALPCYCQTIQVIRAFLTSR
ncbi:hypothetical protein ACFX2I_026121 [Malus domestica]